MVIERPDLDGLRLHQPGRPDVWLMFHGRRHRVASSGVYDALWSEVAGLVTSHDIDSIALGDDLAEGTCLIRADDTVFIHLLTVIGGEVRRCFIPNYESLVDFAFDEAKVINVPPLLLQGVAAGRDITSAASRGLV
jgi:hypothetical protein